MITLVPERDPVRARGREGERSKRVEGALLRVWDQAVAPWITRLRRHWVEDAVAHPQRVVAEGLGLADHGAHVVRRGDVAVLRKRNTKSHAGPHARF
jgi:hypothetical protein